MSSCNPTGSAGPTRGLPTPFRWGSSRHRSALRLLRLFGYSRDAERRTILLRIAPSKSVRSGDSWDSGPETFDWSSSAFRRPGAGQRRSQIERNQMRHPVKVRKVPGHLRGGQARVGRDQIVAPVGAAAARRNPIRGVGLVDAQPQVVALPLVLVASQPPICTFSSTGESLSVPKRKSRTRSPAGTVRHLVPQMLRVPIWQLRDGSRTA